MDDAVRKVQFVIASLDYSGAARQLTLLATALPRDRFDRKVHRYRDDEPEGCRENDPHAAPMSARIVSMTAACTSRPTQGAIGTPKLMLTRFARYAGKASCSSVAMR